MTKLQHVADLLLRTNVARRLLRSVGVHPRGLSFLNRLSYPQCIFANMGDAWKVCSDIQSKVHQDSSLIESNFHLSRARRISDYPVLFWLERIARKGKLRVFDFGGGLGQTFVQYVDTLTPDAIAAWTVMEIPEVVEQGERLMEDMKVPTIRFTAALSDLRNYNVFLTAGALHYWESDMADLASKAHRFPDHVIINRSPIRLTGSPYITIQTPGLWRLPCLVRTAEQLTREFNDLGFDLVDQWDVPEKTLDLPLFPDYQAPYLGMYFKRKGQEARELSLPPVRLSDN